MAFEDGLIHTVAVELDAGTQGVRGGAQPAYAPVPGQGAVACRVVPMKAREVEARAKRNARVDVKVLFAAGMRLTDKHRLVFVDDAGRTRHFPVKVATEWHEQGRGYTALCEEQEN